MLIIKENQITQLESHAEQKFISKCIPFFNKKFPETFASDEELRKCIQLGIEKAEEYDVRKQGNTKFVIEMVIRYGKYFEEQLPISKATDILNADSMSGDERISLLKQELLISQLNSIT